MENTFDIYGQDLSKYLRKIDLQDKLVLDIGCGGGEKTVELLNYGAKVYGCDVKDMRRSENKEVFPFYITAEEKLCFEDNFFDVVINFDVLEHVEKDLLFINEIYRVLKPGGVAYVLTPNINRLGRLLRTLATGKKPVFPMFLGHDDILGDCIHLREYNRKSLDELYKSSKFLHCDITGFWFGLYHPLVSKFRIAQPPAFLYGMCQTLISKAVK